MTTPSERLELAGARERGLPTPPIPGRPLRRVPGRATAERRSALPARYLRATGTLNTFR